MSGATATHRLTAAQVKATFKSPKTPAPSKSRGSKTTAKMVAKSKKAKADAAAEKGDEVDEDSEDQRMREAA